MKVLSEKNSLAADREQFLKYLISRVDAQLTAISSVIGIITPIGKNADLSGAWPRMPIRFRELQSA
jgi:GTP-dependent phosphoenolpyruvate carboxykinase